MEETKIVKPEPVKNTDTVKRKTLAQLFNEPSAVALERVHVHQAAELPGTTQNTLSAGRAGLKDIKMVYHPGYGLIGFMKGKYFLVPGANVSTAHE